MSYFYSIVVYLYVSGSGSITSVGEERANCLLLFTCNYVVSVRRVFFSSSGCLEWATLLAHLSRRLIGELIVYPCSSVRRRRRRRRRRRPPFSNVFTYETA